MKSKKSLQYILNFLIYKLHNLIKQYNFLHFCVFITFFLLFLYLLSRRHPLSRQTPGKVLIFCQLAHWCYKMFKYLWKTWNIYYSVNIVNIVNVIYFSNKLLIKLVGWALHHTKLESFENWHNFCILEMSRLFSSGHFKNLKGFATV